MPENKSLVINTGPLLALIAGYGDLSLLEKLYQHVLVHFKVCQEIEAGGGQAFGVRTFHEAGFLEKQSKPLDVAQFLNNSLDMGEASVIQLALNEDIQTVCIDEAVGRRVARLNGLSLTGSVGVLIRAKKAGFAFSMREAINRMHSKGIYLSQAVANFALQQSHEI